MFYAPIVWLIIRKLSISSETPCKIFGLIFYFHLQGGKGLLVWGERNLFFKLKVTVVGVAKGFLVNSMKTCGGSRSMAPFILNLCTRWSSVIGITPRPLCHGKGLRYRWNRRLGGPTAGPDVAGNMKTSNAVHYPWNCIAYTIFIAKLLHSVLIVMGYFPRHVSATAAGHLQGSHKFIDARSLCGRNSTYFCPNI